MFDKTLQKSKLQHLPRKLLAIRQSLGASQSEMAELLNHYITPARVSECERGIREPNLLVLLLYAKVSRVNVQVLIDDKRELQQGKVIEAKA